MSAVQAIPVGGSPGGAVTVSIGGGSDTGTQPYVTGLYPGRAVYLGTTNAAIPSIAAYVALDPTNIVIAPGIIL